MQTPTIQQSGAAIVGPVNRFYLWSACLVAALGGLMFGYDWVVISGADIFYEKFFQLTSASDIGWAKGCALLGCLAGSLVAGMLSDKFGRKRLLILSALLFVVSSLATCLPAPRVSTRMRSKLFRRNSISLMVRLVMTGPS